MNKVLMPILIGSLLAQTIFSCKKSSTSAEQKSREGGKPTIFKIGSGLPESHYSTKSYYLMADYIEEQTNGAVDVQIFPNNQLGDDKAVVELMQQGIVQMNPTGTSALSNFEQSFNLLSTPYLFKNQAQIDKLLKGRFGQVLLKTLEKSGMIGLGFGVMGFTNISNSVRPIKTLADFQGLKIRTIQNSYLLDFFKELGASPVPMSYGELFSALQQKVVDGQFNPLTTIYRSKFHEVQPYISLTGDIVSLVAYTMQKSYFDSLRPEYQNILRKGVEISQNYMAEQWQSQEKESYDNIVATGKSQINEISDEVRNEFFRKGYPIVEKYGNKSNSELFGILKGELGIQ